jgi:DNA-binding winged helix-turn-helix (wHTH) protein/predicted ATPase
MIYQFDDCIFDTTRDEVWCSGEVINMSPQVLIVLRYLLEHRDRVVSRDELFEQCWPESYVSDAALTSCLKRVRQAIGQTQRGPTLIATRHRRGYQFVAEVSELAETAPVTADALTAPQVTPEVGSGAPPAVEPAYVAAPVAEPVAPPPALRPEPVAVTERRHLTVLNCTLSDVERFTQQLDPEDHYDLMQTFRATTLATITSHQGYMAQHIDNRILVYFGYPQAHEDDAQRAVRSGLALVAALGRVIPPGLAGGPAGVAVQVGIDSGMVLVSSGAGMAAQSTLAMGNSLTRTVELCKLARPGTVVISEATAQLVDGYFDCKALRDPALAGQPESQAAYEVLGESMTQTRIEVGMARGLTPFVGREAELAVLRDRWTYVQEGMGQVVMLRGEAGIGKSRLLQVLKEQVVDEQPYPLECRCSAYHQHTSLYPLTDLLHRALRARSAATGDDHLAALEAFLRSYSLPLDESMRLLGSLLSLPVPEGRYPPLNLSSQRQRERTLDLLSTLLVAQASASPVLFIVEDLHWADPSTLEFLDLLMGQVSTKAMLVILSCRPMFEAPWREPSWVTTVTLNRLTRPKLRQMITQVGGGKAFSAEVMEQLAEKVDGVPLFVEELTRTVLETGQFEETDTGYELVGELSDLSIPSTLHDSLMSRLDRLGPAKEIAQWGAVLGREFTYEMLEKVIPHDGVGLKAGLDRLVASELVFRGGLGAQAQYRFKHALVRDEAYQSLRQRTRQDYHQQIARVLEAHFPEIVQTQPELLAHHYTEAGLNEQAVIWWQRAGQQALQHSAYTEALRHCDIALKLLRLQPDSLERARRELIIYLTMGSTWSATKGYAAPEVERAYAHARSLCQQVGQETPELFTTQLGLWRLYNARAELHTARDLGEQLVSLAQSTGDVPCLMAAHAALGTTLVFLGELALARRHLEQGLALYDSQSQHPQTVWLGGQNPGVACLSYTALVLWLRGYPDQARQQLHNALVLAEASSYPLALASALTCALYLDQSCREAQTAHERAEVALAISAEQGFELLQALSTIIQGWAIAEQGQPGDGIRQISQGIALWRATGAALHGPHNLLLLAEAHGKLNQIEAGLTMLEQAIASLMQTSEYVYEAELYRLKGVLLLRQVLPDVSQAEACFHRALDIARHQQAKSLELRTAISLARLWQSQDKSQEAYDLLAPVYDWFTEGFDTADLQDAKRLLEELPFFTFGGDKPS